MATDALDELDFGTLSTLDVLGTKIELFTAGDGPPLLFLHGIDGIEGSAPLLRELAGAFTVHAPSHPGFGTSDQPRNLNRVDDLGYFYLDLMDVLGLDRPVIVGSSFGGWVAAEIATKAPERVATLILASPFGLRTADRREQHVADIFMLSRQELNIRLNRQEPALSSLPEDRLRRTMRNDEALSRYGWTPYMHNPKLADRLHRVTCPTLIAWGEEDAIIGPAYRQAYAAALPKADVAVIEAAGHRLHADRPEALSAHIAAFAGR
ncbi:alpha/beta fold hydrolase [Rhizorhabdus histidinilytica]|nr:alpha/beta hydrolase [Rhizorhabdus histidinilytica]